MGDPETLQAQRTRPTNLDFQTTGGQRFERLAAKRDWRVPGKYFRGKDLNQRLAGPGGRGAIRIVKRKTLANATAESWFNHSVGGEWVVKGRVGANE